MNVQKLREVADYIVKESEGYNQNQFGRMTSDVACGTECCIAGTALLLENPREYLRATINKDQDTIQIRAQRILGLTKAEAGRLFCASSDWPEKFSNQYDAYDNEVNMDRKGMARVAKRRIEHFIKTRGKE